MKLHAFVAIFSFAILAALSLTNSVGDARNTTWGYLGRYDYLLSREIVVRKSHWMQVETVDVVYPPKGFYNQYNITAVRAIDHKRKDGGYATLIRGGPSYRNVTLKLKSDRNHGLNYTVEIYGH